MRAAPCFQVSPPSRLADAGEGLFCRRVDEIGLGLVHRQARERLVLELAAKSARDMRWCRRCGVPEEWSRGEASRSRRTTGRSPVRWRYSEQRVADIRERLTGSTPRRRYQNRAAQWQPPHSAPPRRHGRPGSARARGRRTSSMQPRRARFAPSAVCAACTTCAAWSERA